MAINNTQERDRNGFLTINAIKARNATKQTTNLDPVTYNPRYPGFNEANYRKLESKIDQLGLTGYEKQQAMDELYVKVLPIVQDEIKNSDRRKIINQNAYEASQITDNSARTIAKSQMGVVELTQQLKEKFNIDPSAPDEDVFNSWISSIPNGEQLLVNYLNDGDKELLYVGGLEDKPTQSEVIEQSTPSENTTDDKKKETGWQKLEDLGVGILQSPGKWGYNMVGQWVDKLGKAAADKLEGTALAEWVKEKAIEAFGEDEVRAFAEQRQKELADGTYYNGKKQTDITTPILGEERANNGWTKAGEIIGDIGTAIALTYPMGAVTAPAIADSTLGGAALLGGMEGAVDTALTHYGSQGNFDVKLGELALGTALGSLGGVLTNKLSNVSNEAIKKASDNVDDTAKATKITSKIADKTDDANKVAGRIGQGDIDDQAKVVKGVKSITDRMGKDSVKSLKTYDQLDDAIRNTEKQIINQEDDLLRKFPEKITDWTTTETVKGIGDQVDDVTRDYIDEGIELLKKYNKNDPVATRELEMLQNTKNTEGLTRLEAKELARKLGSKLSKKFYNSNDELRNSMSAESYEQIRRGIQNAVRDRLPDNTLKNLDLEYSNLKAFEGLTDDMAEKVNTLTQKIKATGPIEKLGRKIGDVINRVTGKGIKGLVEKFLPSNMGNKINNSIDMEIELSKNLSKLVKLNDAIDVLNKSLTSEASKSAITTALRNFANVVTDIKASLTPIATNTAVRGVEAAGDLIYNN